MMELSHINKIYEGDTYKIQALDDITFNIKEGEFVSIMGRSGSGKTTLLNIIGFLDTATSGTFRLFGEDVSRLSDKNLWKYRRDHIGFVFQNFALIDHCSVFENVALPLEAVGVSRRERTKRVNEILELVGIEDLKNKYPGQISGGQKQRVAISRALIHNPKIILADEPTGALDAATGEAILDILKKVNQMGNTVILVTHDEKIAKKTNRLIVLENSRLVSDTPINICQEEII